MSVVATLLVVASFSWLGTLLVERDGAAHVSSNSPAPRDASSNGPPRSDTGPVPVTPDAQVAATVMSVATDGAVTDSSARSVAGSVPTTQPDEPANSLTKGETQPDPLAQEIGDDPAENRSSADADATNPRVDSSPDAARVPSQPPSEAPTVSEAPSVRTSPQRARASTRTSGSSTRRTPSATTGVSQQQWTLLRPPAQAPAGDAAARSRSGTDGSAIAASEQAGSAVGTADTDPARRERWLREQLQIR